MEKKTIGWGWIVFWCFFFPPAGLFLGIRKLIVERASVKSGNIKALFIIGGTSILIAMTNVLNMGIENRSNAGLSRSMFLIFGIFMCCRAIKTKRNAARYKKYADIVVNKKVNNIDNIASVVGSSYKVVEKELQKMIDIGYLKDAYIQQGSHEIFLRQFQSGPVTYTNNTEAKQTAPKTVAVRCPGCGANNVVTVGKVSECEYCGTPLNG